tara:strand:+ start:118 stop:285 length:168 start_codon:yes stop_codon:yes gene_type:complete
MLMMVKELMLVQVVTHIWDFQETQPHSGLVKVEEEVFHPAEMLHILTLPTLVLQL